MYLSSSGQSTEKGVNKNAPFLLELLVPGQGSSNIADLSARWGNLMSQKIQVESWVVL